ncbi:MAG: hypothetical protein K6G18_01820 [Treponema sp.]|nr:hypothetical protein [Treponema sp.]
MRRESRDRWLLSDPSRPPFLMSACAGILCAAAYENAAAPEIKAFLAFVKDNKAESDLTRETGLSAEIVVTL